jgi:hypothetical protein
MNEGGKVRGVRSGDSYWQANCESCKFYEDGGRKDRVTEKARRHHEQTGHRVVVDVSHFIAYG